MGLYVIAGKAKQSHKTKSFFPAGLRAKRSNLIKQNHFSLQDCHASFNRSKSHGWVFFKLNSHQFEVNPQNNMQEG